MNIGLVTGEFPPMQGGVGDFTRELALALTELGHAVRVVTDRRCARPADATAPYELRAVISARWGFRDLRRVREHTADRDIVNLQYQAAAFGKMRPPVHFLPRLVERPTVVTFHDLRVPYLFPKAGRLRPRALRSLARRAAGVVVTNQEDFLRLHTDDRIAQLAGIPIGSNIAPEPPAGFDPHEWRAAHGLAPQELALGYFGFFNESKGAEILIRVLATLLDNGTAARLVHIGGSSGSSDATNIEYGERVSALAAELGVADKIVSTGYLPPDETSAALLSCDLMALPYRDGASLRRGTFMACLNHGRPIITTEPAAPLAQLEHGRNVYLVPRGSSAAIVAAVTALQNDETLRARLGRGARELSAEFGWDKIAAQTADFFEQVLAGPQA